MRCNMDDCDGIPEIDGYCSAHMSPRVKANMLKALDQEATLRAIECLEARYRHLGDGVGQHDETRLTELCEAACGHARCGKLDAADLALSEAVALAVVLGYDDTCHRVLYAARVVKHCRSGSPDPATPR